MEALCVQPWEEDGVVTKEAQKSGGQEEGAMEASNTDEETDEDSEPEPPPLTRRKVSFADAFGLDLVSVKEFDNVDGPESEVSVGPESEATSEEFYMSCLFTVPSSPEELDQRLQAQMVELESIELLPGTTTIRGTIRVVNLCYSKSVYARMSLDRWTSYFDLLAEYLPGSSDRKTDRFTFQYTLVPPFEREGTRVDICLRYDTSAGTFWANNTEMNYVLFCHQKVHGSEPQVQEERGGYRSKRSCLKANRRRSVDEKNRETSNTPTALAEAEASDKAEEADREEVQSLLYRKESKPLVDGIKSRHRATRLARVQEFLSQRRQHVPNSHDPASSQQASLPTPWGDSGSFPREGEKKPEESPQVLTYHEIPLLTLDWNNDKANQWAAAHVDDIWAGRAKVALSKVLVDFIEDTPSGNDVWETFRNGADDTSAKETPVCDAWQAFLNGPSCTDQSGVPESEWLQTAASVSPSCDTQYAASSQEHESKVAVDTPTSRASAPCQLLSDKATSSSVAADHHQPAEACASSPRDDNTATRDASQRSETNSVTDTPRECSLEGAGTPVSGGSVDSAAECLKLAMWEQGGDRIIGGAEGMGGDEPFAAHVADLVTSSGELETTGMTAMAENASAVDRISQGARQHGGLSSSREGQVTGVAHKAADDALAFRGTKDGGRFTASRQGVEEGIQNNCVENKASAGGEIFRPQKTDECEISQRYADEKQREEFRLSRNSENPLQEDESDENGISPAQPLADGFNPSRRITSELEAFKKTEVEPSYCTRDETKGIIGAEPGNIQVLNEEAWQIKDNALQVNSSWHRGNITSDSSHNTKSRPIQEEGGDNDSKPTPKTPESVKGEYVSDSNQTEERKSLSCDERMEEHQEINPLAPTRHAVESREIIKVHHSDTFRPFQTDKCYPNPTEVVETRWTHSPDGVKGREERVGRGITPEEVPAVAEEGTSTGIQRRREATGRTEEEMSQRGKDERVSVGKLKIEAPGESMGNVGIPWRERKSAAARLKEPELSAEVEGSPRVECRKLPEGTKDPITAENTAALEVIDSGLFLERFGEDLIRGIWEEVFGMKVQASNRDLSVVDGMEKLADLPDVSHELLSEKDLNDASDSGVFSSVELDPNSSQEQTSAAPSSDERCPPLFTTEQVHFHSHSESLTDSNSSAHLSQDLAPSWQSSAQNYPKDQESSTPVRERLVSRQESGRQIEVTHGESFNQCHHPPHEHLRSSPEKLKESNSFAWWSVLCILSHITRLLMCTLLVAGFFFIVFLYDFPAFFALYVFSLWWWFYKFKRHRVTADKGMVR